MANLEQSRSRIPDAWPTTSTFLLIAIFYHTKAENRAKESQTQSFCKKVQASAQLRGTWYEREDFLKLHMYVYVPNFKYLA